MRRTVLAGLVSTTAAAVVLTGCTSAAHHAASSTTPSAPSSSSTEPSVVAPLLPPGSTPPPESSSPSGPWSKTYAAGQFEDLLDAFNSASSGASITDTSTFADYIQYSQRIADACDPFLNGLREGQWPVNAQTTIVQFQRLQQVVCDVELARGQAGTIEQYKGVQPPPANSDQQLLNLRLKIYSLLGI